MQERDCSDSEIYERLEGQAERASLLIEKNKQGQEEPGVWAGRWQELTVEQERFSLQPADSQEGPLRMDCSMF